MLIILSSRLTIDLLKDSALITINFLCSCDSDPRICWRGDGASINWKGQISSNPFSPKGRLINLFGAGDVDHH